MRECISAISTANGTGGVAIIRVSGDNALDIAKKMFSFPNADGIKPNYMYSGKIEGEGFTDYGFAVYFKAPKSFTGEDIVEFHCHGGVQIARGILKKTISLGARPAERGEFTSRAFLNGKLTLASAEGMADMINAESLALVRAGSMMYFEKLSVEVKDIQNNLKDILARIAVEIDYPEEDEDGLDFAEISKDIGVLNDKISRLIGTYSCGKKIKSGVTVAICGEPNTGKSSLLNALMGYGKAIVSAEAGTTRDAVEGEIELDGVKFNLIDTAGIRENAGEVESIGIERAKKIAESADILLFMCNGKNSFVPQSGISGEVVRVFNKCDIERPYGEFDLAVSAKTGTGMEELKKILSAKGTGGMASDGAYIVEERHYLALNRAKDAIESAMQNIQCLTADIISVDLKEAWEALGEITGETASEEIISTVFEKFCVGK